MKIVCKSCSNRDKSCLIYSYMYTRDKFESNLYLGSVGAVYSYQLTRVKPCRPFKNRVPNRALCEIGIKQFSHILMSTLKGVTLCLWLKKFLHWRLLHFATKSHKIITYLFTFNTATKTRRYFYCHFIPYERVFCEKSVPACYLLCAWSGSIHGLVSTSLLYCNKCDGEVCDTI